MFQAFRKLSFFCEKQKTFGVIDKPKNTCYTFGASDDKAYAFIIRPLLSGHRQDAYTALDAQPDPIGDRCHGRCCAAQTIRDFRPAPYLARVFCWLFLLF